MRVGSNWLGFQPPRPCSQWCLASCGRTNPEPYRAIRLTVAWRRNLLPARCFTSTLSFGWHHFTPFIRELLKADQEVVRRSTSAKKRSRSSPRRRSEEHTSELQSLRHLVCRLLLEKKKKDNK